MVTLNCCPITRSSYTALVADILSAMTYQGTALERPFTEVTDSSNFPSVSGTSCKIFLTAHWESFTMYLSRKIPTKPEFALEDAAKSRCKLLVDSPDMQTRQERLASVDASQSIFMNYGTQDIPKDPEHSNHRLRQTGKFLADWSMTTAQEQVPFTERMECWARALRLAQDKNAVSVSFPITLLIRIEPTARTCLQGKPPSTLLQSTSAGREINLPKRK